MTSHRRLKIECNACHKEIVSDCYLKCSNKGCKKPNYHNVCVETTDEKPSDWMCMYCQRKIEKNEGSSEEPQPQSAYISNILSSSGDKDKQTEQDKNKTKTESSSKPLDPKLYEDVNTLRTEVADLSEQVSTKSGTSTHCMDRLDEVVLHLAHSADRLRQLENWQFDIYTLKYQVAVLQESLQNQIEIIGVPEQNEESLLEIITIAAQIVGIPLQDTDMDWVSRTGPKVRPQTGERIVRPIVARFVQRFKCAEFLKAAKSKRNLTAKDFGYDETNRIYINERLTRENRFLFQEARSRSKQAGFKYCWTSKGYVYVRKREGFPAMRLLSHHDLTDKLESDNNPALNAQIN